MAMRTFEQLDNDEQAIAIERMRDDLLDAIIQGALRFDDGLNGDGLQARIDAAIRKADDMQTPWLAPSYIYDTCAFEIDGMARATAEDALYRTDEDPPVVTLRRKGGI